MCGIAGFVGGAIDPRVREVTVRRMTDVIRHRGPDDDGFFSSDEATLGMRRLSIIDVAGGHQPIGNEAGNVWVVLNGEIYNHVELRRDLESHGHRFSTRSDTEVIVHGYEEFGEACVQKLRGMFAFALWDDRERKLFIAIDRMGIKPLYYADTAEGLLFGSELKCLTSSGRLGRDLDYEALFQYFTLTFVPPPRTVFRSARKLPPAHVLTWSASRGADVHSYWDLPLAAGPARPIEEVRRELREQLRDAVRSHLVSDVPLGALLSGGADSSAVVALMHEVGVSPIKTFTIGFSDPEHDERGYARLVAERYHTEHHEMIVEPEAVDLLPRLAASFDEPFADSSALPTYYVSKLARQHVTVALAGDGGDELFLGYPVYQALDLARRLGGLPGFVRRSMTSVATGLPSLMSGRWADSFQLWGKRVADNLLPPVLAYRSKMTRFDRETLSRILSPELREAFGRANEFAPVDECLSRFTTDQAEHSLAPFVYTGFKVALAGDMLVKVDRMSMANSLEVRVPLLDHVLVEFASAIPLEQRFPRWRLKGLLKDTMADALPSQILNRPKHGFTVPLARWFRGDVASLASDILLSTPARDRGMFDAPAVEDLLREHRHGRRNVGSAIWSLLMFELWCRQTSN